MSVDRALRLGLAVTVALAVAVLAFGTVATQRGAPPLPDRVVAANGTPLFTRDDIVAGKAVFQRTDLMDFGSLYGNGAYFGPDWGAQYLRDEAVLVGASIARDDFRTSYDLLTAEQRATVDAAVAVELRTNRYVDGTLTYTDRQAAAYGTLLPRYEELFLEGDAALGLPPNTVRDAAEADRLAAYFSWIAWTSVAVRPGDTVSYTNNWPYEPLAGNVPTPALWTWTWVSLAAAAALAILVLFFYRRFLAHPTAATPEAPPPLPPTPSQRATKIWFVLVPALLIAQGVAGVALAHYYAARSDLIGIVPFVVLKAWHLQLAIAWVAAAWMGAGLFLAPIVGRREPRFQRALGLILLAAVVLVVAGSAVGVWAGVSLDLGPMWFWIGNQGLEYVQLGRAFQIGLFAGLLIWAAILARAFWPALRARRSLGSLEHLLLYSGIAIGVVYAFGMFPLLGIMESATLTDYWRWFVVHLWVENVFEFFTVAVIGYALLSLGLASRALVERTVYVELILVFAGGIVGTGHHFYWAGEPAVWMALGGVFSMLEVIPLAVMLFGAWRNYAAVNAAGARFPQRTAFLYFSSAAVWNAVGAGVIGGIINPPIVNYYEHGTFFTLAHGHSSMFGVFGLLALGLVVFSLHAMSRPGRSDRLSLWALGLFNLAIVLWLALNILPVGAGQLVAVLNHGFAYARSLGFNAEWETFQWFRLPGDLAFLAGGALFFADVLGAVRSRRETREPETEARLARPAVP